MKRFSKAEAGDLVYCRKNGRGKIIDTNALQAFPIRVLFETSLHNGSTREVYTLDGYMNTTDAEPLLFYRSSTDNYLTERPEPEVDWTTVEMGTMVEVCDDLEEGDWEERRLLIYLPHHKLPYWAYALHNSSSSSGFRHARLVKETPTCQKA